MNRLPVLSHQHDATGRVLAVPVGEQAVNLGGVVTLLAQRRRRRQEQAHDESAHAPFPFHGRLSLCGLLPVAIEHTEWRAWVKVLLTRMPCHNIPCCKRGFWPWHWLSWAA